MFEQIVEACRYLLNNYPEARESQEYLDSRISRESQEKFGLGFFPSYKDLSALSNMIGEQALIDLKLLYIKSVEDTLFSRNVKNLFFENHNIVMPFRDAYGREIAMVGRTLMSEEDRQKGNIIKYKNTFFKKGHHLYGLYENKEDIMNSGFVYVVEGQFDVIKATECGIKNIVAVGNSYLTPYQFSVLCRYTDNIHLLLDNDEAGEKGRKKAIDKFGNHATILNMYLPEKYKDVDSFFQENTLEDWSPRLG